MNLPSFVSIVTPLLLLVGTAQAAVVLDFAGGGPEDAARFEVTLSSGTPDTVTEIDTGMNSISYPATGPSVGGSFTAGNGLTGSLAGVGGTLAWDQISSTSWSLSPSNVLNVSNYVNVTRNGANGWGVAGGDIETGDLLGFTFDFSALSLPPTIGLRIVEVSASLNGGGDTIEVVVDGVGSSNVSPSGLNGEGNNVYDLSIDLTDGLSVGFSHNASDYRLDTLTLETFVIPEPATLALIGVGGVLLMKRRRR